MQRGLRINKPSHRLHYFQIHSECIYICFFKNLSNNLNKFYKRKFLRKGNYEFEEQRTKNKYINKYVSKIHFYHLLAISLYIPDGKFSYF